MIRRMAAGGSAVLLVAALFFPAFSYADDDMPPGLGIDTGALISQAQKDMNAKSYAEAENLFKQVLESEPDDSQVLQDLGNAQWAQNKKADAVKNYRRCLEGNPNNVALTNWMVKMGYIDSDPTGEATSPTHKRTRQNLAATRGTINRWSPLWRSALCPGWGQEYNGETVRAWIVDVGFWGLVVGSLAANQAASQAEQRYNSYGPGTPQSDFDSSYNTWNQMTALSNDLAIGCVLMWGYGAVDAFVCAKPHRPVLGLMPDEQTPVQVGMLQNGTYGAKVCLMKF